MKKRNVIIAIAIVCLVISLIVVFFNCNKNDDVIRLAVGSGKTYYFVLKSDGKIQVEVGVCEQEKTEKGSYDLKKGLSFKKTEKLGYSYVYGEYYPGPEVVDDLIELAENTCIYATNDEQDVTDATAATLWYNGRQVRRHSHKDLPTDMQNLLDLFVAISPVSLTVPNAGA